MNRRGIVIAIAGLVALAAVVAIIAVSRERIAHRSYARSGSSLIAKLSAAQEKKYGPDLRYTLEKFWKFYDKKLVSQNDLNDVMDKTRALRAKKDITDMEIFDYITYVSTLYTEAMRRRQSEMFPE